MYYRNTSSKVSALNVTDEEGNTYERQIYPFKWLNDTVRAIHSFRDCYEQVLIPKSKYPPTDKELIEQFYN